MLYPHFLWFHTSSTLYFSFLLIMFDSSAIFIYCPLSSLHYISRSSLNMLYITHSFGNFSWNVSYSRSFMISKGLYFFLSSFFEGHFDWIFLASNHMLSSCFNLWRFYLFLSNYFSWLLLFFSLMSLLFPNFSKKNLQF